MRKIIVLLIAYITLFSLPISAGEDTIHPAVVNYPIVVNGNEVEFDKPIISINDSTYIPLREFCETLDYDITWDNSKPAVNILRADIGDKIAFGLNAYEKLDISHSLNLEISEESAISLTNDVFRAMYGKEYAEGFIENSSVHVFDDYAEGCYAITRYQPFQLGGHIVFVRKTDGKIMAVEVAE